jgi:aryl-alcohol dehydrogenase-like predicted oxidoreductase
MDARSLGRTDLRVTRLGIGLAAVGRPGYVNVGHGADLAGATEVDRLEARAHAVLDAAFGAGIGYVDVARSYGRAEAFLASWLASRGITPGALSIGTKWGYTYTAGWRVDADRHEVKDHSLAMLRR